MNFWKTIQIGSVLSLFGSLYACNPAPPRSDANTGQPSAPVSAGFFEDRLASAGINFHVMQSKKPITILESVGNGAGVIDINNDNLLDIVLLGPNQARLFLNRGSWKFEDVTETFKIRQQGTWQGVAVGDYDNDGFADLYLCGYNASALYHNEQGTTLKEVTTEVGLAVAPPDKEGIPEWRTSAAFLDVDQDSKLDLYVCRYAQFGPKTIQYCPFKGHEVSCAPEMYKGQYGSLFMNVNGKYRDETKARGLSTVSGRSLGIAVVDYDSSGRPSIALANDEIPGNLFKNVGKGQFKDISKESGTAYDGNGKTHGGMGIDWGDYNDDGRFDLFVTTYENETKTLYRFVQGDFFMESANMTGIVPTTSKWVGWGTKFFDFDCDGALDLFMASGHVMDNAEVIGKGSRYAQPIQLFRNLGNGRYEEVSAKAGNPFTQEMVARAVCLGDFDNDGKQDLLVSSSEGKPLLLRNTVKNDNHWLGLHLTGKTSNRMAIGATVRIKAGALTRVRYVSTTGSVLSAHDQRVHFGLGTNQKVDTLEITWPNGNKQVLSDLPVDQYLHIVEGETAVKPLPNIAPLSR